MSTAVGSAAGSGPPQPPRTSPSHLAPMPTPSPSLSPSSATGSSSGGAPGVSSAPPSPSSAAAVLRARAASSAAEEEAAEHAVPRFSPALEATLAEVFPSSDPLDAPEFDPIAFINAQFPDEASLVAGKLDTFLGGMRRQVATLQESITRDVRAHSQARSQTARAIASASESIGALFSSVELIKQKATASEAMVQDICRDIRALDTAKQHLTDTIRALRNLHMLVSAVGQLDAMVAEKQYRLAAERLRAIQDLFTLFDAYGDVPKIRSLQSSVEGTRALMKEQLTAEFHRVLPSPLVAQEPQATLMADACCVVDVLDRAPPPPPGSAATTSASTAHFKADLLNWFCALQLEEYAALFAPGKEGATIEQIERRYSWLKTWLRTFEARYTKVFPSHWMVAALVAREFCKMTRIHVNKMLTLAQARGGLDVQVMIQSLLATMEFEKLLNARYKARPAAAAPGTAAAAAQQITLEEDEEMSTEARVEEIKRKYARKLDSERQAEEEKAKSDAAAAERAALTGGTPSSTAPPVLPTFEFKGMISECFTPYMAGYVEMERKNLADLIQKFDSEENWAQPDAGKSADGSPATTSLTSSVTDRFNSSNDMFQYIKNSINRCTKLNKNVTLFALWNEYRRGLSQYCQLLDAKLPKKQEGQALSQNEIVLACYVINTCEYVQETLPGLCERMTGLIEAPYQSQLDIGPLSDEFGACIAASVAVLVASMWSKLNKVLAAMTRLPWSNWPGVGDESPYVQQCALIFREELPLVASKLSPRYHPFFCSQIASTFVPRFVDSIYACRRIGEMGAQQMSLDAHALKNVLLAVPSITANADPSKAGKGASGAAQPVAASHRSYHKYVNTEMSKAEALIKTLVSPAERLIVTFKALLPRANVDDLMRIMNLRGLKRAEQEQLVASYNATVGAEDQLKLKAERGDKFSNIFSQLRSN